jgi:hypothetical protein
MTPTPILGFHRQRYGKCGLEFSMSSLESFTDLCHCYIAPIVICFFWLLSRELRTQPLRAPEVDIGASAPSKADLVAPR